MSDILSSRRQVSDAHVIFYYKKRGEFYILLGRMQTSGILTSFGGKVEGGETARATLVREYLEETFESIVNLAAFVQLLEAARDSIIEFKRSNGKKGIVVPLELPAEFEAAAAMKTFHAEYCLEGNSEIKELVEVKVADVLAGEIPARRPLIDTMKIFAAYCLAHK